jgi:hypothetical protein
MRGKRQSRKCRRSNAGIALGTPVALRLPHRSRSSSDLSSGEGEIIGFSIEKRAAQKPAQVPPPQRSTRLQRNSARVLTEKKGVFWACFAEKRGSGLNYLTLCFAFSPVFGTLCFSKPLRLKENRRAKGSKINRA